MTINDAKVHNFTSYLRLSRHRHMYVYHHYPQCYMIWVALALTYNKSPAVARVSRPYRWCTLATCVLHCDALLFLY